MRGELFNTGWTYRRREGLFGGKAADYQPVDLPHDAMLGAGRDPDGDPLVAHYRSGAYEYEKILEVPAAWADRTVVVRFEGVYRDAGVFLNGEPVAQRPYGYSEFAVRLDDHLNVGEANVLRVECRNGRDTRWYSGAGIYRDVTLFVADPIHVALDGVRVSTPDVDDELAIVDVAVHVQNDTARRATVVAVAEITGPDGETVTEERQPVTIDRIATATATLRLLVPSPRRWRVDDPQLYSCAVRLIRAGDEIDVASTPFGIRTLAVDARRGLRINGETVKLRGACIHHDNGVVGAATFAAAEERRIVRLKEAGFNAVRSAHHPMSRALLDACDRHGMLVMDEAFDVWRIPKRDLDYSTQLPTWWRRDLEAMVVKDINHPSVILYSIGNEIEELGCASGAQLSREMANEVRRLDPSRPVTNAVNVLMAAQVDGPLNELLATGGMETALDSDLVAEKLEESYAVLDVAGYNYADQRYVPDGERFPSRVIIGTETFPRTIDRSWRKVIDHDHVIGDFTWTGWDYLGEVGIGRVVYDSDGDPDSGGFFGDYPWRTAACADIDLTGRRLPLSYYREIVFGLRQAPYIAVRPPAHQTARKVFSTAWSWTSAVASWTWDGDEGRVTTVEVYADADEVELFVNERSAGRAPAGEAQRFLARFEVTYEPGELTAVALRGGRECGRSTLRTADADVHIQATAERSEVVCDGHDLAFIDIALVDDAGTTHPRRDLDVLVAVNGPGVLQGLGSGAPSSDDDFRAHRCRTYRGHALAVVRPTGPGEITVRVRGVGVGEASLGVTALARDGS